MTRAIEEILGQDEIVAVRRPIAEEREKCIDCWFGKSWTIKGLDGVRNDDYNLMHTQQVACLSSVADQVLFAPYWENLVHHFQNR